jgi:hypothetical protein
VSNRPGNGRAHVAEVFQVLTLEESEFLRALAHADAAGIGFDAATIARLHFIIEKLRLLGVIDNAVR